MNENYCYGLFAATRRRTYPLFGLTELGNFTLRTSKWKLRSVDTHFLAVVHFDNQGNGRP